MSRTEDIIKRTLIFLIQVYRHTLRFFLPGSCRFHPSCSEYAISVLEIHGIKRGVWLTVNRLVKCHPFHPGGYDPAR